jgi:hypothetical protein
MTAGNQVLIEVPDVVNVGDVALAQRQTIQGTRYPFAARVFGTDRPQYAYYSFVATDLAAGSIAVRIYWTTSAPAGSVGWIVSAATLKTTTTTRILDKDFAADNGTFSTAVLGSWRFHETSYLINNDSYSAGAFITLRLSRDVTDKTAAADAYVIGCTLAYTGQ